MLASLLEDDGDARTTLTARRLEHSLPDDPGRPARAVLRPHRAQPRAQHQVRGGARISPDPLSREDDRPEALPVARHGAPSLEVALGVGELGPERRGVGARVVEPDLVGGRLYRRGGGPPPPCAPAAPPHTRGPEG